MHADPFDARERRAWEAIIEVLRAIDDMDERGPLPVNREALCEAAHVMQQFVTQHMNHRLWPHEFGDWWEQDNGPKGN